SRSRPRRNPAPRRIVATPRQCACAPAGRAAGRRARPRRAAASGRSFHRGFNRLVAAKITGERPPDQYGAARHLGPALVALARQLRKLAVKVIASSLRKGNIVEFEGKLYAVLNAESFHPGKGTPTTQVDMRRISDGVKVAQRFKTTEQVERAYVED